MLSTLQRIVPCFLSGGAKLAWSSMASQRSHLAHLCVLFGVFENQGMQGQGERARAIEAGGRTGRGRWPRRGCGTAPRGRWSPCTGRTARAGGLWFMKRKIPLDPPPTPCFAHARARTFLHQCVRLGGTPTSPPWGPNIVLILPAARSQAALAGLWVGGQALSVRRPASCSSHARIHARASVACPPKRTAEGSFWVFASLLRGPFVASVQSLATF